MSLKTTDIAEQELDDWVHLACMEGKTDGLEHLTESVSKVVDQIIRLNDTKAWHVLNDVIEGLLDDADQDEHP